MKSARTLFLCGIIALFLGIWCASSFAVALIVSSVPVLIAALVAVIEADLNKTP